MAITNEEAKKSPFIKETNTATDEVRRVISPANFQVGSPKKSANLDVYGGVTTLSGSSPALVTHGDVIVTGSIYTTDGGGKANLWSHSDVSAGDIYYNDGDVGVGTNDPQTTLQVGSVVPSATDHADAILGAAEIGSRPGTPTDVIFGNTALDHSAGTTNYALKQTAAGFTSLNSPTILQISNAGATSMLITAGGVITIPNQPMCYIRGLLSLPTLTTVGGLLPLTPGVPPDGQAYDPGNHFDGTATNHSFTAPITGRYLIQVQAGLQITTAAAFIHRWWSTYIYINGLVAQRYFSGLEYIDVFASASARYQSASGTGIFALAANDVVQVFHDSSATTTAANYRSDQCAIAVTLLG